MKISNKGLALIKKWEGYKKALPDGSCQAYLDTVAKPPLWTIGWGCTEGVTKGMVWTKAHSEKRLLEEVTKHEKVVKQYVKVPMNQHQYDALVSFSYNYGMSPKRTPTLLKAINSQNWKEVARLLPAVYGCVKGKPIKGLINRRNDEAKLLLTLPPKEVVKSSSKLTFLSRMRAFIVSLIPAGGIMEWMGYLEQVKAFAQENWHFMLLGIALIVYVISKWLEHKTIKDHEEGRYTPSGAADDSAA